MVKELENIEETYYLFESKERFQSVYGGKNEAVKLLSQKRIMKDYALYIIIDGTFYIAQGETHHELKAKEGALHLPNIEEEGYQESDCSYYWLHFIPQKDPYVISRTELLRLIAEDPGFLKERIIIPSHFLIKDYERVTILINLYLQALREFRNQEAEDYFLTAICSEISRQEIASLLENKQEIPSRLQEIIEYINIYYFKIKTIAELAQTFGYNPKYLSSLFKKQGKGSPKAFLEKTKIYHASAMLIDTNLSVKEIANLVGFADEHLFMRVFKKEKGSTPSKYRKNI